MNKYEILEITKGIKVIILEDASASSDIYSMFSGFSQEEINMSLINPDYALENILRLKLPSKYSTSLTFITYFRLHTNTLYITNIFNALYRGRDYDCIYCLD